MHAFIIWGGVLLGLASLVYHLLATEKRYEEGFADGWNRARDWAPDVIPLAHGKRQSRD